MLNTASISIITLLKVTIVLLNPMRSVLRTGKPVIFNGFSFDECIIVIGDCER